MARKIQSFLLVSAVAACYLLATYFKVNGIQGSVGRCFSLSNCFLPLIGAFFGFAGSYAYFAGSLAVRFCLLPWQTFVTSCFGLPTLAASLYWTPSNRMIKAMIPLACMLLFALHPVGLHAMPYTLYWLIPACIAFMPNAHHFLRALGSTFSAHAVGSVCYLYGINAMTPTAWIALIPVVAYERMLFACGMYGVYLLLQAVGAKLFQLCAQEKTYSL